MKEGFVTLFVSLVSALVPVVNLEAYLAAAAIISPSSGWAGIAFIAALAATGQMIGKLAFYFAGRGTLQLPRVLGRHKTKSPDPTSRRRRFDAWWSAQVESKPWLAPGLVATSASVGIPPLAVVSVVAGYLRVPLVVFLVTGFLGRWARFAFVFGGVGWAAS